MTSTALQEVQQLMAAHGFNALVQDRKGFAVVNATFFKASRFQLVWSDHRSRVLLCSLLLPDGRELGIANVHLEASAGARNEAQRASQLKSALRRLRSRASWCEVVCGDFNSSLQMDSPLRAQLVQADLATAAASTGLTYAAPGYHDTLDHIWAGKAMRPVAVLGSSSQALGAIKAVGLPDAEHPSDHLPVATTFHLAPSGRGRLPLAVEPPIEVSEALRTEWLLLLRSAPLPGAPKREVRQQRCLEVAFLEIVSSDEAAKLRAWKVAAAEAAGELLQAAVRRAALAAADVVAKANASQTFDPGGLRTVASAGA